MRFRMIKNAERVGINHTSRNFGCSNQCGCQGCNGAGLCRGAPGPGNPSRHNSSAEKNMKKIKLSDYNETVTSGGKEYVYNFYTGAIIEFENGQKLELEKMSKEETDFLEKKALWWGET